MDKSWRSSIPLNYFSNSFLFFGGFVCFSNSFKIMPLFKIEFKNLLISWKQGCQKCLRNIKTTHWRLEYSPLQWAVIGINISQHSVGNKCSHFYFCGNCTITISHVGSATRTMNHRKGPSAQATTLLVHHQGQILYLPLRHDYNAGAPPLQPEVVIHYTMLKLSSHQWRSTGLICLFNS